MLVRVFKIHPFAVASVQITTMDLIKEGDWIEVPAFDADGNVININLHSTQGQLRQDPFRHPNLQYHGYRYCNCRGMKEAAQAY